MSYVRNHLQEGELLIYTTTVHWIIYERALLWSILAAIIGYFAFQVTDQNYSRVALEVLFALLVVVAFLDWLRAVIRRVSTELAITDRRIIVKTGLIRRNTFEMNRGKVESVSVDQSILGRLLNFGTITIKGTGGGIEPFVGIDHPIKFRSYVTAG